MAAIGVMTKDIRFFHGLVEEMKARRDDFIALDFADEVPPEVAVIITTPAEAGRVKFREVVAHERPESALDMAEDHLAGRAEVDELIIGVDPGVRPGVAAIGDGRVLVSGSARSPEAVADEVLAISRRYRHRTVIARIGLGDPTNRDRAARAIWSLVDDVEVVDETSTTHRTEHPDADAAVAIALSEGRRLACPPEVRPTPGEIRDIQRLSRIESGGRVTISQEAAGAVARGEITLAQALSPRRPR